MLPQSLKIIVRLPGHDTQETTWQNQDTIYLGRAKDNTLVLDASSVSRYHGVLRWTSEGWVYEDLGSRNGSFVNGQPVQRLVIDSPTVLQLGRNPATSAYLTVQPLLNPPGKPPNKQGLSPAAHHDVHDDIALSPVWEENWTRTSGFAPLEDFQAQESQEVLIGRHKKAHIRLDAPVVSRWHARLRPLDANTWFLEDLRSRNGTFVNGQRIQGRTVLHIGDIIQIGPFHLVYQGHGQLTVLAPEHGLRLDGIQLSWYAKKKKILHEISIACEPQEFVALVGGSGAGKSTLMRVLSGYLPPTVGEVLLAGQNLYEHFDAYRDQLGYVPQDDILHADLTVYQALWYAAKLRLSPDLSQTEIEERITQVLEQVELTGQQHQRINSLSGGQRKRASIAGELLADPPVLFLDEPTSGLDPGLEKKMMYTLRKLADSGKTILLVTHATANIAVCDQVAFLSQGRLVYYGPPEDAKKFFQVESFADIYDVIHAPAPQQAEQRAEMWRQRYQQSPFYRRFVAERIEQIQTVARHLRTLARKTKQARQRPGNWRQFFYLTHRYARLITRDFVLLSVLGVIMPLLAGLILIISKPKWLVGHSTVEIEQQLVEKLAEGGRHAIYSIASKAQALLFMMALAAVLLGLFSAAYEIIKERHVYRRERMVFLSLLPYLASKVFLLELIAIVQIFVFLLIIRLKVQFPAQGVLFSAFWEMWITLSLATLTSISLGLFISAVAPNTNTVVYIILGVLFFQILFAGVLFNLPGPSKMLSFFTLSRWTTESLGISVDMERLNALSQTRFIPGEITQEVTLEVEKPDPNWEPVTITTELQNMPGCSQPVAMPVIQENEMRTVMEEVSQEVTIEPDPITVETPLNFEISYHRTPGHLLFNWVVLLGFSILFGGLTLGALRSQDVT